MAEAAQVEVPGNPENGQKQNESGGALRDQRNNQDLLQTILRALAVGATLAAAIVMGTNKQTKSIPVVLNNVPLVVPVTAKYSYTPAFVYFVVANAIACGYAALSLLITVAVKSRRSNFTRLVLCSQDLVAVALLSTAAAAAAAISEVGRNGNSHSRWNKICDKYGRFCSHGGGAILASFVGVGIFMVLNLSSTYILYRRTTIRR